MTPPLASGRVLLTADGMAGDLVRTHLRTLCGGTLHGTRAAIVTTASIVWKERNRHALHAKAVLDDLQADTSFFDFERDDPERLSSFDLIYLSGGNPFHLLKWTRASGADRALHAAHARGGVLIGASAGALLLGPHLRLIAAVDPAANDVGLTDLACLGLHEMMLLPHASRYARERRTLALAAHCYAGEQQMKITLLNDGDLIVVTGRDVEHLKAPSS